MGVNRKILVGGAIFALVAGFGIHTNGQDKGYTEGRNESYTMWQGANGVNRAYGSWKFIADCARYFNDTGVKWDQETTVLGPMVEKDEGIDKLTIFIPNIEQINRMEPKPTKQMEERAKRLQEALCTEKDGEPDQDEGYGTAYTFTLDGNKVRYHTQEGKAKGFHIPFSLDPTREITIITPQRKSEKGTEKTAKAFAAFFYPENEGIERG